MTIHETLRDLTEPMGVSGDESEIAFCIRDTIRNKTGKDCGVDHIGNVTYNVNKDTKVLFTAHMDEIGLMISGYTDDHKLEFTTVGGFDPRTLPNTCVTFKSGLLGVIGTPAPHLVKDRSSVIDIEDLTIDCGFASAEEAEKEAPIGTTAVIESVTMCKNGKFFSRNTDNRAGCAVLMSLVEHLPPNMGLAFLVREEVGLLGMRALCDRIKPEVVINLDVTPSGKLGDGPVVNMKDAGYLADRTLVEDLKLCGLENIEVSRGGTSDHSVGQLYARAVGLSFPSKYIHSSVSCVHLDDLEKSVDICLEYINLYQYEGSL